MESAYLVAVDGYVLGSGLPSGTYKSALYCITLFMEPREVDKNTQHPRISDSL